MGAREGAGSGWGVGQQVGAYCNTPLPTFDTMYELTVMSHRASIMYPA
jgi:hypothetical protein